MCGQLWLELEVLLPQAIAVRPGDYVRSLLGDSDRRLEATNGANGLPVRHFGAQQSTHQGMETTIRQPTAAEGWNVNARPPSRLGCRGLG